MYIAIEGVIGVGKTTLARLLQPSFNAELLLEIFEENPFLSDFYSDRERFAFQTQIFFLLSRYHQQRKGVPESLKKNPWLISDYTFEKDRLFGGRDHRQLFRTVSKEHIQGLLDALPCLLDEVSLDPASALRRSFDLEDFSQIEQAHLRIVQEMGSLDDLVSFLDKTHLLLHFLEMPAFSDLYETILMELGDCLEKIRGQDASVWTGFLRDAFRALRENLGHYGSAVLDSVHTIGREVYDTGSREIVDVFIGCPSDYCLV